MRTRKNSYLVANLHVSLPVDAELHFGRRSIHQASELSLDLKSLFK
jgi:hypothetical protein